MRCIGTGLILITTLALACGDDSSGEGTGNASTSEGTTAGMDSTGVLPTGPTGNGTTAGSSVGDSTTDAATAGTTTMGGTATDEGTAESSSGGGSGALEVEMSGLMIFQDCMPIVPPDPTGVTFTLTLTATSDLPASATVVSATFSDGGGVDVGTIGVTPTDLGPVPGGESVMVPMTKTSDSLMPPNGCGVLMCNQMYTLELELDVGGATVMASDTANVDCVF